MFFQHVVKLDGLAGRVSEQTITQNLSHKSQAFPQGIVLTPLTGSFTHS